MADSSKARGGPAISSSSRGGSSNKGKRPDLDRPAGRKEFYAYDRIRVKRARLSYRHEKKDEWHAIADSYPEIPDYLPDNQKPKDTYPEPWNVEQLCFSKEGIVVNQYGKAYSRENFSRGGHSLIENEYCWRVVFNPAQIDSIRLTEGQRPNSNLNWIDIEFKCLEAPVTEDATRFVPEGDKGLGEGEEGEIQEGEAEEGDKGLGEREEGEIQEGEAEEGDGGEGEAEDSQDAEMGEEEPNPETFPLAQLFKDTSNVKSLQIRLTFFKGGSGVRNPYLWSWPAAVAFLSGRDKFLIHTKLADTKKVNEMALKDWIKSQNSDFFCAKFTFSGEGFWLKPKPLRSDESTSQNRQLAPSQGPVAVPQFGSPLLPTRVLAPAPAIPGRSQPLGDLAERKRKVEDEEEDIIERKIAEKKEEIDVAFAQLQSMQVHLQGLHKDLDVLHTEAKDMYKRSRPRHE